MGNIIRTASHQQIQVNSVVGPADYTQGDMTLDTGLGRVDEAMVVCDDPTYVATVTGVSENNTLDVVVSNLSDGAEVAGATDLSGVQFTFTAVRK